MGEYLGDGAADERGESQGHQVDRGRLLGSTRDLDGNRHEDAERADVLYEGGQQPHGQGQKPDLAGGRVNAFHQAANKAVEDARPRNRLADHQHGGHHHDHLVGKAYEGLVLRHDTDANGCQQRANGDEIIAPAVPDEDAEHDDDDGNRRRLIGRQSQHGASLQFAPWPLKSLASLLSLQRVMPRNRRGEVVAHWSPLR